MSKDAQHDLRVDRARRGFFRALTAETLSTVQEMRGVQQVRLDQIHVLPDRVIATMVPVRQQQGQVRVHGSQVVQHGRDGTPQATLVDLNETQVRLFSHFDGVRSVGEIARDWATEADLSEAEALLQVKRLFLPLAKLAVLVPAQSPEQKE